MIFQAKRSGHLILVGLDIKANDKIWNIISTTYIKDHIKLLDISGISMKSLPPTLQIFEIPNMKILRAKRCNLQRTPVLSLATQLKHIHFSGNDLEETTVDELPLSLTMIDFSTNHFRTFPPAFISLVFLIEIDLSENRLNSVEGIGALINLQKVKLDSNELVELPLEMEDLVKLKILSIKDNNFSAKSATRPDEQSIPKGIFINTQIDTLEMDGCSPIRNADVLLFDGIQILIDKICKNKKLVIDEIIFVRRKK